MRAEEVEGNVRFVPHDPAVVRLRRDVEGGTCRQVENAAVVERGRRMAGQNDSEMLDAAAPLTELRADVLGPFPARFVRRAAQSLTADGDELEPSLFELPHFVRLVEAFQDRVQAGRHS